MKRGYIVLLCILILALSGGCGQASYSTSGVPASASDRPAEEPRTAISSQAVLMEDAEALVIESQYCYDTLYSFCPEADGTYHFSARTADDFQGKTVDYDGDAITWTVYVLQEEYTDASIPLSQTHSPAILNLNSSVDLSLNSGEYVYCVCSLNSSTGNPAADGSGTLTVTRTEASFLPDASNNYQLAITVNCETWLDLDGDGTEEEIFYSVLSDHRDSNGVWTGSKPLSLRINGAEYVHPERDNPMEGFGFWMENPETPYYYIVDLDAKDSFREIAIADWGSSGYLTTHFFRYADGSLVYLGMASGLPDDHNTIFWGDGTLSAMDHLNVMQTWSGVRTFELGSDNMLHAREGEFVQPVLPDGWEVTLNQSITVYQTPDLSAATVTLTPGDTPLSFPLTDGVQWVEIVCTDGSCGWAYFSDACTLVSEGQSLSNTDVFNNMLLAG